MHLQVREKLLRFDRKQQQSRTPSPHFGAKQSYSQYLSIHPRAKKYLSPHQRQQVKMQTLENEKLRRRLSAINGRKSQFMSNGSQLQDRVRQLSKASRKLQKIQREKQLQEENDYLIDRIAKARTNLYSPLELSSSQHRAKRPNNSMLLPAINPEYAEQKA